MMNTINLPDYNELIGVIHHSDEQNVGAELDRFWNALLPALEETPESASQHLLQFATAVTNTNGADLYNTDTIQTDYMTFVRNLASAEEIQEIRTLLYEFCQRIFLCFSQSSADSSSRRIEQIQTYLKTHLDEELSLTQVSAHFYLNAAYLSRLFREKTGMTFSDYLADLRVTSAKELLVSSPLTIYEIARKVGYEEANSFSRLFKKRTGMSPQKYRSVNRANAQDGVPIPTGQDGDPGYYDMGPCIFSGDDANFADFFLNR